MTSPRPSPIGEGVKKGKTQIIPVGSIHRERTNCKVKFITVITHVTQKYLKGGASIVNNFLGFANKA